MAITPRSKGLGNIGAIVDRQGRASPTRPVAKAAPKPAPRPAPKPVAKVAPKPAPKMAPKPNPFAKKPDTRAPGGRFVPPSDYTPLTGPSIAGGFDPKTGQMTPSTADMVTKGYKDSQGNTYDMNGNKTGNIRDKAGMLSGLLGGAKPDTRAPGGGGMDVNGNPIGGGMGAQMNFAKPGQGNLARNTGPGNGGPQLIGGAFGRPIFGQTPSEPNIFEDLYNIPMAPQYNPSMGGTQDLYNQYNNIRNRMTADVRPEDRMNFQQFVGYRNGTYTPPPDNYVPDFGIGGNPYEPMPQPGDGMYPNLPPTNGYDNSFINAGIGGDNNVNVGYVPPLPGEGFGDNPYVPSFQNMNPVGMPDMTGGFGGGTYRPEMPNSFDDSVLGTPSYNGDINSIAGMFGEPDPYGPSFQNRSQVFNQRNRLGTQPRPTMTSAFSPYDNNDYGPDIMGGGSGSLFGGGGFAGK